MGKILILILIKKKRERGPKKGKNRVFGLLRKIESLVFSRNDLKWSVLWLANFLRKPHIWENSHSQDLCAKALDLSDRSLFQITIIFWTVQPYLIIFCIKTEYHIRRLRCCCHFSGKMPVSPKKGKNGAKVGRAVGKNQLFYILLKIGSLYFFNILYKGRGY